METGTLFDIGTKPFEWSALIPTLGLVLFGLSGVWMEKKKIGKVVIKKVGYVLILLGIAASVYVLLAWEIKKHDGFRALQTGTCVVVEGPVQNFHPMPISGHPYESFSVGKESFSYSDNVVTPCFNNTFSHGGPIREGLRLRVSYRDECILRIELISGSTKTN